MDQLPPYLVSHYVVPKLNGRDKWVASNAFFEAPQLLKQPIKLPFICFEEGWRVLFGA